jgi:(S)-ureidoglycine aminohydrolase
MHQLGQTRSAHTTNYLLQTPETFVRAPLPGMRRATAIVHASPAIGAMFTQYTAELEAGGEIAPVPHQRFVYVLEGSLTIDGDTLGPGGYAYVPAGHETSVTAAAASRAVLIEKPYEELDDQAPPTALTGQERSVTPTYMLDDPWLEVRALIPDDRAFDFRINTMTYQPGATLPAVEIHVMEHGLLMLDGGGIYRLGGGWFPVAAGDFIWMGPYCPQWFGALGKSPAKYLIYKDWDRHPL